MRRLAISFLAVVFMLAGCSSSEPLALDLSHPMEPPEQPFQISGPAEEEGVVCGVGMWTNERTQTVEGADLDFDGWAQMFDSAVESKSVAEAKALKQFECGDGSGTITINEHTLWDFAVIDPADLGSGETDVGTWTIEGTGDYESLTGSGGVTIVWDEMQFHYIGEVEG